MSENQSLRDRLIECGVELLARDGTAGVSLRAITREANVSHGAPRRYFPTHNALLAAIAAVGVADLAAQLGPIIADESASARDRLVRLGLTYVRFAQARPAMFELMFHHDLLEGAGENLRASTVPMFDSLTVLVRQASHSALDPRVQALAILSGLHGIAVLSANRALELFGSPLDIPFVVERAVSAHL